MGILMQRFPLTGDAEESVVKDTTSTRAYSIMPRTDHYNAQQRSFIVNILLDNGLLTFRADTSLHSPQPSRRVLLAT